MCSSKKRRHLRVIAVGWLAISTSIVANRFAVLSRGRVRDPDRVFRGDDGLHVMLGWVIDRSVQVNFTPTDRFRFCGQMIHARTELPAIWRADLREIDSIPEKLRFVFTRMIDGYRLRQRKTKQALRTPGPSALTASSVCATTVQGSVSAQYPNFGGFHIEKQPHIG